MTVRIRRLGRRTVVRRPDGTRLVVSHADDGTRFVDVLVGHAPTVRHVGVGEGVGASGTAPSAGVSNAHHAPTTGVVRELLVAPGATVAEGDPLLRLEAMKTVFTLRAAFAGVVREVRAAVGEKVERGALLVQLSPA